MASTAVLPDRAAVSPVAAPEVAEALDRRAVARPKQLASREEQIINERIESALGADSEDGTLGTAADQSWTESEKSDHGPDETAA
jgi:hypothetical protein